MSIFSKEYLDFIQKANKLEPLTNQQHKFAEWCLKEENAEIISQQSNSVIFDAVRKYLKNK